MSDELEFQWGAYVGSHMEGPLRVCFVSGNDDYIADLTGIEIDGLSQLKVHLYDGSCWSCKSENCKPQLKSLESLSDEEWLFVFVGSRASEFNLWRSKDKKGVRCYHNQFDLSLEKNMPNFINGYRIDGCWLRGLDQQILNRLHSLHRSEKEKELLKAGLVEVVDG
jgi:hypothetical protein